MQISDNTILITGGATGIGLALAEQFVQLGNSVIICSRRENKLSDAKQKTPAVHTRVCNISNDNKRIRFAESVIKEFPVLNILIKNAGIQQDRLIGPAEFYGGACGNRNEFYCAGSSLCVAHSASQNETT